MASRYGLLPCAMRRAQGWPGPTARDHQRLAKRGQETSRSRAKRVRREAEQ